MTAEGRARPGGRTARIAQAVYAATLVELGERPYEEISVETIATRSGVHKTTIYRRWHNKPELVANTLRQAASARIDVADTGTIDGDLRALSRSVHRTLASPEGGAATRSLVIGALSSPEIAEVMANFWQTRLAAVTVIVTRAIARAEIPDRTDAGQLFQSLVAPLFYRLLVSGQPSTEDDADRNTAAALAAARAGVFVPAQAPVNSLS